MKRPRFVCIDGSFYARGRDVTAIVIDLLDHDEGREGAELVEWLDDTIALVLDNEGPDTFAPSN